MNGTYRGIAVVRCSSKPQLEKYGPENQMEDIRQGVKYFPEGRLEIVSQVMVQESASSWDRKRWEGQIDGCLDEYREGNAEVIIFPRVDRETRFLAGSYTKLLEVIKSGMLVYFALERLLLDPEDKESFEKYQGYALEAQAYIRVLRRNTMRGSRQAAGQGKWVGGQVKYGIWYKPKEDKKGSGTLEIDQTQAEVLKGMFQWVAEGKTARSWCRWANKVGIPTKRGSMGWRTQQVSMMLRDRAYTGKGAWGKTSRRGGKLVPGDDPIPMAYPRIISDELFDRVQAKLAGNRKKSRGSTTHFYLLQHLGRCGECGGPLGCHTMGNHRYFYCFRQRFYPEIHQCYQPQTWDMGLIDRHVWADVEEILDDYQEAVIDRLAAQCGAVRETLEATISKARKELERCQLERQRILTAHRKGWATEAEASLQFKAIKADEEQQQLDLAKAEASRANTNAAVELIHTQIGKVLEVQNWWWHTTFGFTDQQKKEILNALLDSFVLYRGGRIELRLKVPTSEADMAKVLTQSLNAMLNKVDIEGLHLTSY